MPIKHVINAFQQAQLAGLPQGHTRADQIPASTLDLTQSAPFTSQSLGFKLPHISRLEQLSAAANIRELDARRAIALLCGRHVRYFIKSTTTNLGRSTNTLGKVHY